MSSLIDAVLFIGIVAFFTGLLLGVFSKSSKVRGTTAWKWRNILLIIGGTGLFMAFGGVSLWDYSQESQISDLIYGLLGFYFGPLMIWDSISELRQSNQRPKTEAFSGVITGMVFIVAFGALAIFQSTENSPFSFRDLIFVGFGVYILFFSIHKITKLKTTPVE
ncbi:MAG: hypothetical protein WAS33_09295 [Candidatus Promineifilaceae bacterium]|nr:hypothetical protein [Anaerolineaceae bacterium]